jgi:hypothetical protein
MILRFLPYLGMLLTFMVIIIMIVLAYRHANRDVRLKSRRQLAKQVTQLELEKREVDRLLEELVDTAKTSRDTEPLLADSVILKISGFKSQQHRRKELFK